MLFFMIGLLFSFITSHLQAIEKSTATPIIIFMAQKDSEEKIGYAECATGNSDMFEITVSADMFSYEGALWQKLENTSPIGYFLDITATINLTDFANIEGWTIKKIAFTTKENFLDILTSKENIILPENEDMLLFLESLPEDDGSHQAQEENSGIFHRAYSEASAKMRSWGISLLLWYLSARESLATLWTSGE